MDNADSLPEGVVPLVDLRRYIDALAKGELGFDRGTRGPAPPSEPRPAQARLVWPAEALGLAYLEHYRISSMHRFPVDLEHLEWILLGISGGTLHVPWSRLASAPLTALFTTAALRYLRSLKRWLRWAAQSRLGPGAVAAGASRRTFQLATEIGKLLALPDWTAADRMRPAHRHRHSAPPDGDRMRRTWEVYFKALHKKHLADEETGKRFGWTGRGVRRRRLKESWERSLCSH